MPRGEILDIWLDTATRKRKQETKGDHTGAGDDPAAGIPSVGALTLSLTLTLTLSLSLTLTTLTTLTLIVCVGQRGPRADLCQYCVIGWNNNLSKVLHGPVRQVPRAMRAALRALNRVPLHRPRGPRPVKSEMRPALQLGVHVIKAPVGSADSASDPAVGGARGEQATGNMHSAARSHGTARRVEEGARRAGRSSRAWRAARSTRERGCRRARSARAAHKAHLREGWLTIAMPAPAAAMKTCAAGMQPICPAIVAMKSSRMAFCRVARSCSAVRNRSGIALLTGRRAALANSVS